MQAGSTQAGRRQVGSHPSRSRFTLYQRAQGFTFVWMLLAVALLGLGLAQAGPLWTQQAQREREAELLRIGALYAKALDQYRRASPGTLKRYPTTLEALERDERFLGTQRWMRKTYTDPMRPGQPWGLLRDEEGGIRGVYSTSTDHPLHEELIFLDGIVLEPSNRYSDWHFVLSAGADSNVTVN